MIRVELLPAHMQHSIERAEARKAKREALGLPSLRPLGEVSGWELKEHAEERMTWVDSLPRDVRKFLHQWGEANVKSYLKRGLRTGAQMFAQIEIDRQKRDERYFLKNLDLDL